MYTRKNARRAFLSSIVALVLCLTMLMGTTFAWFTDTASVAVNKIVAGTLDIDIVDEDGAPVKTAIGFVKEGGTAITSNILWEPGCSYILAPVKVVNNGNLWAKIKVYVTATTGETDKADLASVIDVYEDGNYLGTLRDILTKGTVVLDAPIAPDKGTVEFGTLKFTMQTTAGNDYQGCSLDGIGITVYATQYTEEEDSYNDQYDKDAAYFEKGKPITSAELADLIANDEDGVIELTSDVVVSETIAITKNVTLTSDLNCAFTKGEGFNGDVITVAENAALTLDGVNFEGIVLDYTNTQQSLVKGSTGAKITLKNVSITGCTATAITANGADVVLDNGTVMTNNTFTRHSGQGGVVVDVHTGSLTINDGVVVENNTVAYARDGLFAAYADAKIVMNGGKISNNVVTRGTIGSVIYVQGTNGGAATASFTMNGGEISNNKGIYASAVASRWCNGGTCSIILNAGTIKGNTTAYPDTWNDASVFYRCNTTIGADMVIEGVVYGDEDAKNGWTLTDNRS